MSSLLLRADTLVLSPVLRAMQVVSRTGGSTNSVVVSAPAGDEGGSRSRRKEEKREEDVEEEEDSDSDSRGRESISNSPLVDEDWLLRTKQWRILQDTAAPRREDSYPESVVVLLVFVLGEKFKQQKGFVSWVFMASLPDCRAQRRIRNTSSQMGGVAASSAKLKRQEERFYGAKQRSWRQRAREKLEIRVAQAVSSSGSHP